MRIAIQVNDPKTEKVNYTTTYLAAEALKRQHEVFYFGLEDWTADTTRGLFFKCTAELTDKMSEEQIMAKIQSSEAKVEVDVESIDLLLIRHDPADEGSRKWARKTGLEFPQLAKRQGVLVLNDPDVLNLMADKFYLLTLPSGIIPPSIISRDVNELRDFANKYTMSVFKPLGGSKGRKVFFVEKDDQTNFNQIVETLETDGYVLAQEFIEEAAVGDIRIFMLDGKLLEVEDCSGTVLREHSKTDLRNNIATGGTARVITLTDRQKTVVEELGTYLKKVGLFFVGVDFAGEKVIEINVHSAGGLKHLYDMTELNFGEKFIQVLEQKFSEWKK